MKTAVLLQLEPILHLEYLMKHLNKQFEAIFLNNSLETRHISSLSESQRTKPFTLRTVVR